MTTKLHTISTDATLAGRAVRHLNQIELSRRWRISERTLERWRWIKEGPKYLKIGGRVCYRLEDVEQFEVDQLHTVGSDAVAQSTRKER